ncbi:MAG: enoyl-CoA hydratase [Sphingomonadales bacterium]|nr:enoyl-CoA hydratase [Sphingomonadales bacterium]
MSFDYEPPIDYSRYEGLKLSFANGIATVTLSNPGKKNAVTPTMSRELTTVWEDLWRDSAVRVIILTGDGDAFCSGVDISQQTARQVELADTEAGAKPVRTLNSTTRHARKHVMSILECEKPVLAKVRGPAYGMGCNMALACDMVFVSESAMLCDSHVKIGLVAGDGGVLLWPLAVGIHRAKEYLMTGAPVPAKVAENIGLVNRCLPDDELDAHVQKMAETLRDLPPHAVNYTKASLNIALKQMTQSAFEASVAYEIYTMEMEDHREAGTAFVQKRKGNFTGN